ncbi:MAG: hypothetical protein CME62_10990 [Halobacteriovoraceae bacterium]|nr:hypothetical protein [Halobacteriovoraceae bacterium]|tara:strand:+ start:8909 stop:10627 length:1719 start_codon:yes stop_codon:yes gene_type:complete
MKAIILFTLLWGQLLEAQTQTIFDKDHHNPVERNEFLKECLNNKKILEKSYSIICEKNYHHYNSSAYKTIYNKAKALRQKKVRIAEFNALHPGMSKTKFKDYTAVAKMMNKFDVIGVTELIPLMSSDAANNDEVVKFMQETPKEIVSIKKELRNLRRQQRSRHSVVRDREINLLELKKEQLENDLQRVSEIYREPGYVKILSALRKLSGGEDWALILSPRGEGAVGSPTPELVGYYYRASVVKPLSNPYCRDIRRYGQATAFACIIDMDKKDLGRNKQHVFSRRPFLAEFISGNFSFVLVTSHVLFDSPNDENVRRRIMRDSLGLDAIDLIGVRNSGLKTNEWARWAEIQVTLEFIAKYMQENKNDDVIYMGDFNLETENQYWPEVLKTWGGSKLYISDKTSTNNSRYHSDGSPTHGVTSNYDHFIFNPKKTSECVNSRGQITGGAFNFQKDRFAAQLDRKFKIRREGRGPRYNKNAAQYRKLYNENVDAYLRGSKKIETIGHVKHEYRAKNGKVYSMSSRGILNDEREAKTFAEDYQSRVLDSQLHDDTYYGFYKELISDHLPIYMDCSNN